MSARCVRHSATDEANRLSVRYRLIDVPTMLRTPAGRRQVADGLSYRSWPLVSRIAKLYRRTFARRTRVIAIVGSFGKSTTTRAVAAVLSTSPQNLPVANAWTSIALAILRIKPSQRYAPIEVGIAGPGQMALYAAMVRPDITVVTSVGSEHHTKLGSLQVTRSEKAHMVVALPSSGVAVLNGDDPNVVWMRGQTKARVITVGFGDDCAVRARDVYLDWPRGMRFRVSAFGEDRDTTIRLIGRHMVYAALAAIAVAHVEGLSLDDALACLADLAPTPGRLEPVILPSGAVVLRDDYKATSETIYAALDVLAEIPGRRIVLFGDLSEPQGAEVPIFYALGTAASRAATDLVVIGKGLPHYASGAIDTGMPSTAIVDGGKTVSEAAAVLRGMLGPNDVLLLKARRAQKLDRVRMILQGRDVRCDIPFCDIRSMECEECPMLERGWGSHRAVM